MSSTEPLDRYEPVEFHGDVFSAGLTGSRLGLHATVAIMLSLPGVFAIREMVLGEQPGAAAILVILFAVPCAISCDVLLRSLTRRADFLSMNAGGVSHAILGRVPWRHVDGYHLKYRFEPRGKPLAELILRLSPAARPEGRAFWRPTPRPGAPMRILLAGLDRSPQQVLGAVVCLRKRQGPLDVAPDSYPWPGVAAGELHQQTLELLRDMRLRDEAIALSTEWGQSDIDVARTEKLMHQSDVDFARLEELATKSKEFAAADRALLAGRERPWRIGLRVSFAVLVAVYLVLEFQEAIRV